MLLDLMAEAVGVVLVVVAAALITADKAAGGRVDSVLVTPQLAMITKPNRNVYSTVDTLLFKDILALQMDIMLG